METYLTPRIPKKTDSLRTVYKVVTAMRMAARSHSFRLSSVSCRMNGYVREYVPGVWMEFPHPAFVFSDPEVARLFHEEEPDSQLWECETTTEPYSPPFRATRWLDIPEFWSWVEHLGRNKNSDPGQWYKTEQFCGMDVVGLRSTTQWVVDLRLVARIS